eukprot:scaffold16.g93.t1
MVPPHKKKHGHHHTHKKHDKKRDESPSGSESDSAAEEFSDDQEDEEDYKRGGYHRVQVGERFKGGRYTVLHKLGWGHFSTVWMVRDEESGGQAAMKVVKSAAHYTEAARDEVTLLTQARGAAGGFAGGRPRAGGRLCAAGDPAPIKEHDPHDAKCCVRLLDSFDHTGPHGRHVCMVFEVMGDNLLTLIRLYDHRGLPLPVVLVALDYLHTTCKIIHTDLKPENVMLKEPIKPRKAQLAAAAATAGGPAPPGGRPSKLAAAVAAGEKLTKNQKKKLKQRQKKKGEGDGDEGGDTPSASTGATGAAPSEAATASGDDGGGEEASSGPATAANGAAPAAGGGEPAAGEPAAGGAGAVDLAALEPRVLGMACKIVDFGNACWTYKHFTEDIQTRQYRAPEVILGAPYDASADVWSLACMVFELVTGDFLFEPRAGADYSRDEDHLAQMIELLERMPRSVATTGRFARDYFTREGRLRHIHRLKFWPLDRVLGEKYKLPPEEAHGLRDFLEPMLNFVPGRRATAAQMLQHPWLRGELPAPRGGASGCSRGGEDGREARRAQERSHSRSRSRSRSRTPKRSRSPSPPKGYTHHSPGRGSGANQQQQQQQQRQQPKQQAAPPARGAAAAGVPAPASPQPPSPQAAADLTASAVLVSSADLTSPRKAGTPRGGGAAAGAAFAGGGRKSIDSTASTNSSGWEVVQPPLAQSQLL